MISLSIVIVNWNTRDLLADCCRSIPAGANGIAYHVVVVDNASTDGSADMVARDFPNVQLIRSPTNLGFAGGNNLAIRALENSPTYVLLLNSDAIVRPGSLKVLSRFMDEHPQTAACSPRLLCPDGSPQPFAFGKDPTIYYLLARGMKHLLLRRSMHDWNTSTMQSVDWVAGTCMLVRQEAINQVGLLDENIFMYFEDNDWCLRFRKAGWKIYYVPQTEIVHVGGQSLQKNPQARQSYDQSLKYFYRKHYGVLAQKLLEVLLFFYRKFASSFV